MHRFAFNKPSKMFSKHYDDENKDLRFSQNGSYSFENLLQETKTKGHSSLFMEELDNEFLEH